MREIKFRAWDRKAKKMFPVHEMKFDKISNKLESYYGVDIWDKDSDFYGDVSYGGSVHKKTGNPLLPKFEIMQYTGLKDKNGNEVYEGDIIKLLDGIDIVEFKCGGFMSKKGYMFLDDYFSMHGWLYEVIGNIYENPELLED